VPRRHSGNKFSAIRIISCHIKEGLLSPSIFRTFRASTYTDRLFLGKLKLNDCKLSRIKKRGN